ncbi:UNVERIFIED_CONTAM: hypothetical protein Scaly_1073900 [Sesamum calycinum]|uniref:Uncharacterized protein n=1 Tax=Sesamum calycinum TaxID=2727403 RepID=A0AAW2QLD2_9LAMI
METEVVENRVQVLKELEELDINEKSAVNSVVESLTCTLNKTILQVAAKYLESDISGCIVQFLVLGTKANIWCRKHLKMTLMSTEDSPEEEHSSFFYQLVLDLLSYSTASYSTLARYPVSTSKELVVSLENFILEQFTLTKDLVSEIKRIHLLGTELLKAAQGAIDALIRLCKVYCNGVKWDAYHCKSEAENIRDCTETENGDHVIRVTSCTIEKLCELGTVAANDGGSLVSLLNMSWKGVVSLLQFGKGALAAKVNVTGVIMNLISLASESLKCAAETWSTSTKENISVAEAKRIFLPVKFYLINAVRIISQYQTQALFLYKEIALCVVMILTFRISLSTVEHMKSASEVLAEILEPTSLHLLNSLLNSAQVKQENKFQILEVLFSKESDMSSEVLTINNSHNSLDAILSVNPNSVNKEKMLSLGQVALLLNLLLCAPDLEHDVTLGVARKLGWLLDMLVDEDVYASILVLQTPTVSGSTENHELTYQPMFCAVLHALKTFMVVVSSSPAWDELELFLIDNLFHPHFLCWDIVTELWCFMLRHADPDRMNNIFDKLCELLMLTSREPVLFPESALRKTARLICVLVTYGPEFMVDRVYSSIFESSRSQDASNVHIALLMEGFPLNLLSEKKRSIAKQRLVTEYYNFLERFEDKSPGESDSAIYGAPVFALCAALRSLQVSLSDTDMKTLKFLNAVIHKYETSSDDVTKDNCRRLLGELLGIICNMKHLYSCDGMEEVILGLQKLFISRPALSDSQLFLCKPNLAYFMSGLGHVELADSDDSPKSSAAWELYHMLLRERHWALFTWRSRHSDILLLIPLAINYGAMQATPDQLAMLVKEGQLLNVIVQNNVKHDPESIVSDMMDVDDEKQPNKKRKFPDGICKGVELLQSGLRIMVDGLSQWKQNPLDSTEVHEKFLAHFSRLEDVIAHLVSLADSG